MKIVESYKEEITKDRLIGWECDGCHENIQDSGCHVPLHGIFLTLSGGYGAYYDGRDVHIDLCKSCTEKLFKLFPILDTMTDEACW